MNYLLKNKLNENERKALTELKKSLKKDYQVSEIVLYGSKARAESDTESDIDVLVVLDNKVDDALREKIFNLSFEIELKYDVVFGILIEQGNFWSSSRAKSMPIYWNIKREGIPL